MPYGKHWNRVLERLTMSTENWGPNPGWARNHAHKVRKPWYMRFKDQVCGDFLWISALVCLPRQKSWLSDNFTCKSTFISIKSYEICFPCQTAHNREGYFALLVCGSPIYPGYYPTNWNCCIGSSLSFSLSFEFKFNRRAKALKFHRR